MAQQSLRVLKDIDLEINTGEQVAIMGASGSGKSALPIISGIPDHDDDGAYIFDGAPLSR
jgi:ABC-type lipoprotein export system ATPase subunit